MKLINFSLALFFLFLPAFMFSQEIIGDFNIKDSTQNHIITTSDGDILEGRVTWTSPSEIIFLYEGNKLIFKRSNISKIEVLTRVESQKTKASDIDLLGVLEIQNEEKEEEEIEAPPQMESDTLIYPFEIIGQFNLDDETQLHKITTKGNDLFVGKVISLKDSILSMSLDLGAILNYPFDAIQKIEVLKKEEVVKTPQSNIKKDSSRTYVLITERGDRFVGRIKAYEGDDILFQIENNIVLTFNQEEIETIQIFEEYSGSGLIKGAPDYIPMSGQENLFISPSAFNYKTKKGEYRNTQIFLNSIDYGVSDNFSLGAGLIPFFVANVVDLRTKLTFNVGDYVHFGAGAHLVAGFTLGGLGENWSVGIPHGTISIGTEEKFLNVGFGKFLPFDDNVGNLKSDLIMVGGSFRISKKGRIFADLIKVNEVEDPFFGSRGEYTMIMIGGSWFNVKNRLDFGVFVLPDSGTGDLIQTIGFPVISYARKIGKGR